MYKNTFLLKKISFFFTLTIMAGIIEKFPLKEPKRTNLLLKISLPIAKLETRKMYTGVHKKSYHLRIPIHSSHHSVSKILTIKKYLKIIQ